MKYLLGILVGVLLIAAAIFIQPADAQTCDSFDEVIARFPQAQLLEPEQLETISENSGQAVTRGFLTPYLGYMVMGLEVGGCLLPPIPLGPLQPVEDTGTPA